MAKSTDNSIMLSTAASADMAPWSTGCLVVRISGTAIVSGSTHLWLQNSTILNIRMVGASDVLRTQLWASGCCHFVTSGNGLIHSFIRGKYHTGCGHPKHPAPPDPSCPRLNHCSHQHGLWDHSSSSSSSETRAIAHCAARCLFTAWILGYAL